MLILSDYINDSVSDIKQTRKDLDMFLNKIKDDNGNISWARLKADMALSDTIERLQQLNEALKGTNAKTMF